MTDAFPPAVSVVIPCFNQARYLPASVRSVREQRYQPVECIVVDDGSSDDTAPVARSLGVHVIGQPNRGVAEARNVGLAAVAGEFVVFLDADDELLPDAVALGVLALSSNTTAAAIVGRCRIIDAAGRPLPARPVKIDSSNLYREWLYRNFVWTPGAALFRTRALNQIGGFPTDLGPAADYAVYLRLARTDGVLFHAEDIVRYRQHDENMSRNPVLMLRATLAVLRRESRDAPAWARVHVRRGRTAWVEWYGEQIVDGLRNDWHSGKRGRTQVRAALTLMRYGPALALQHAARKGRRVLMAAMHLACERLTKALAARQRKVAR
jgi:glycosyltransferase involved in cell wall biosynthesis